MRRTVLPSTDPPLRTAAGGSAVEHAGASTARRVVVFDLDGTIVAGDAFATFARHLITRSRPRCAAALASAPAWAPALARVREHQDAGHRVVVATGCAAPLAQQVRAVAGLGEVEVLSWNRR